MFFSLLRTKKHEVAAVTYFPWLIPAGNVLPIFEPVRHQWSTLKKIATHSVYRSASSRILAWARTRQLVRDLPALSAMTRLDEAPVCSEYRAMHRGCKNPKLAKMKECAIRHDLLLMTVAQ